MLAVGETMSMKMLASATLWWMGFELFPNAKINSKMLNVRAGIYSRKICLKGNVPSEISTESAVHRKFEIDENSPKSNLGYFRFRDQFSLQS